MSDKNNQPKVANVPHDQQTEGMVAAYRSPTWTCRRWLLVST